MRLYSWLIFLAVFVIPGMAKASVWQSTRAWNTQAETEFSQWLQTLDANIFTRPGTPYFGIRTDCADAAYTLRIIFSFEHGLPVKFQDSEQLANSNSEYDSIANPNDRVKAFIRDVNLHTGTSTLTSDTYPIEINRQMLRPGAMFLHAAGGENVHITDRAGHVYYIQDVYDNGTIKYLSSTVPIAVRKLTYRYGVDFAPFGINSGYRAWKRPGSNVQPGMSSEQFHLAGWHPNGVKDWQLWDRWQEAIQSRVRSRLPTSEEKLRYATLNLQNAVAERVLVVKLGWSIYQTKYHGMGCMGKGQYDDYSTPTRDRKIQLYISTLQELTGDDGGGQVFQSHSLDVGLGSPISLATLYNAFMTKTTIAISEPEHSPEVRWGVRPQGAWPCPHNRKQYYGAEASATN